MRSNQPSVRTASARTPACAPPWNAELTSFAPMNADRLHGTAVAALRVAARWAALEHTHVAEREIVFRRVLPIEPRERGGDLGGGLPRSVFARGEAEVSRELVDVDVDRDDERAR